MEEIWYKEEIIHVAYLWIFAGCKTASLKKKYHLKKIFRKLTKKF
jgi:hypothetical protein